VSLLVKLGALVFILFFPTTFAINLQLLSTMWIVQTLPVVFLGLYTNWFHKRALLIGLLGGLAVGTWLIVAQNFSSVVSIPFGSASLSIYAAIIALALNLTLSTLLTFLFNFLHIRAGEDETLPADFEPHPVAGPQLEALEAQISQDVPPEKSAGKTFHA
jgi:SSS family solute:Na+ symporter